MRFSNLGDRAAAVGVGACGVLLGGHFTFYLSSWGSEDLRAAIFDVVFVLFAVAYTGYGLRVARHRRMDARTRLAWRFITASFACQLIGHSLWFVDEVILHRSTFPSIADYWFLINVPFMFTGLLLLPGAQRSRRDRVKLALDALIVGASTFMVFWYLVLSPIFATAGASFAEVATSAGLPVGDLLLVFAVAMVLLRRGGRAATPVRLLAGAVVAAVVADVYYGYIQLHAGFVGGTWPDLFWSFACYLMVLAAHRQYQQTGEQPTRGRPRRVVADWLPYAAIALAYLVLGHLAAGYGLYPLGGMIIGVAVLTTLVVARQMYMLRENRELAVTDTLTGLANRALMNERLLHLSRQSIRDDRCGAVLLIDLDRFKPINDTYGHDAGDAVLQAVATALRSVLREGDTAGRLGGDEFAVIMPGLPGRDAAESIAQRLLAALRTPVIFGDHLLSVQASIGVAIREDESADGELLLQHADTAMYAAKRSGRGRYAVYSAELDTRAREAELRGAITNGELIVHYQPAVDLADGRIVAVEALVRWQHPSRGLLMPGEFIELAEETGAVIPLGESVLRTACRQLVRWHSEIPQARHLRLSVNLSPKQVAQANLVEVIRGILADTGFPAHALILELTEGVILEPAPHIVARLESLREMGIGIAIDDFGTGYSALSYLRRLPVNILKIDRSFVIGIADDRETRKVAEAVVRLGEAFRMKVVAEGIETAEQAALLADMGCRFGQGFHFHPPLDRDSASRLLRTSVTGRQRRPA